MTDDFLESNATFRVILKREVEREEVAKELEEFAKEHGLNLDGLRLTGKHRDFEKALNTKFFKDENGQIRHGSVAHDSLGSAKEKVFTFLKHSEKPAFKRLKGIKREAVVGDQSSYNPPEVARLYNFPTNGGAGQKIGIIELGGGYNLSTINKYLESIKVPEIPKIKDSFIDGAMNNPSDVNDSGEVYLDLEIIASVAHQAEITTYFAPNTNLGFIDAISRAVEDGNNAVSISWASPEEYFHPQDIQAYEEVLAAAQYRGTVVFVSSGDAGATNGSYNGTFSVNYPSSSPYVVSAGGTSLAHGKETAWIDGGGGFSLLFPDPSFQASRPLHFLAQNVFKADFSIAPTTRGLPDLAANADPNSGYNILTDQGLQIVGGTSAVAPLLASLVALLNVAWGKRIRDLHPYIYDPRNKGISPVSTGNNGGYFASSHWNPCTGVGSVDGQAFLSYLISYH